MFQSQVPDVVGPVRSVRLTDPLIVWPVGGVFAYSGGAQYAVDAIKQAPVSCVDESAAGDAMFRDRRAAAAAQPLRPPGRAVRRRRRAGSAAAAVPVPRAAARRPPGRRRRRSSIGFTRRVRGRLHVGRGVGHLEALDRAARSSRVRRADRAEERRALRWTTAGGVGNIGPRPSSSATGPFVFTDGRVITGTWTRPDKATPMKLSTPTASRSSSTPGQHLGRAPRREVPRHGSSRRRRRRLPTADRRIFGGRRAPGRLDPWLIPVPRSAPPA